MIAEAIGRTAGADGSTRAVGAFAPDFGSGVAALQVLRPVDGVISKRLYRHISQEVCPRNRKFSQELAADSPFKPREFIAGKGALTLAREILALDHEKFTTAFRKSPMMRAKLAGVQRNTAVVLVNDAER